MQSGMWLPACARSDSFHHGGQPGRLAGPLHNLLLQAAAATLGSVSHFHLSSAQVALARSLQKTKVIHHERTEEQQQ